MGPNISLERGHVPIFERNIEEDLFPQNGLLRIEILQIEIPSERFS